MSALDTPLAITNVRLHEVAIPLARPFRISGGVLSVRRSLIVEVEDRTGARGYGESAPFEAPFYSEETLSSARACLVEHLMPRVRERAFGGLEEAVREMARGIRGNRFARAGLETALWDLVCAKANVSLRALLALAMERMGVPAPFRASRGFVESGAALGIPDAAEGDPLAMLGAWTEEALAAGHRRVKIKVQPGWDVEPIRAVRRAAERRGVPVRLWADANGSYERPRDLPVLRAMDGEALELLEQPLDADDVQGTLALAHELTTAVCVDESLVDDHAAQLFLAAEGPKIWNIKVQRVGGLWEAVKIYKRAVENGVVLWGGTMPETGVGTHAIVCLGAFAGFTLPTDVAASHRWYRAGADLVEQMMDGSGRVPVNDAPGLSTTGLTERLSKAGLRA